MKRYLLIVMAIVICIVVGAPFATGIMAEKQYHSMIRTNPFEPTLKLESKRFERGLFSSRATTFVEVKDTALRETLVDKLGKDENGKLGILIHHDLKHGPLIFTTGQEIGFAIARATHHVEQNDSGRDSADEDLLQLDTRLHFDGSQTINIISRDITTKNEGAVVTLMPLSASLVTDKSYRTMKGSGDWKGMISTNNRGETLSLSDARFELDAGKSGEMWLGTVAFTQSSIALNSPEKSFQIDGLKIQSRSSEHDNRLIDSATDISLRQVKATGKVYGPGELNIAINNIPATALERLNTIQQRVVNASPSDQTFALQAAGIEALGVLPELLSHGIVINMERLYFNTPDGEVVGRFNLRLPKSNPASLLNIPHLKSIIELDAGFSLPVALIPEATMRNQVQPLLERGYLKMDGGTLKSEIRMSSGVVTMNDQVVPLPY
ncbi:MAG: YdgA family protein [Mariprofundaceae bacterium]|nr:YdgA family protein [Mariprofundaceae bacterium]